MDKDIRAAQFGMLHGVQVAIRALVSLHPDPEALVSAFAAEHQESMSLLLAMPVPDIGIEAYKDFLRGCAPSPDEWLVP